MFLQFFITAAACCTSFTIGYFLKEKSLSKEKNAIINAKLKMPDVQNHLIQLQNENERLEKMLEGLSGEIVKQ